MARRHNARGRSKGSGGFIMLMHGVQDSPAYKALSGDAVKLLLGIWRRYNFNAPNNGELSYSVREAAILLNCRPNTAGKRVAELIDHGFLVVTTKGKFNQNSKKATTFRITLIDTPSEAATRDYQRWRPANGSVSPNDTDDVSLKNRTSYRSAIQTVSPNDTVDVFSTPKTAPQYQ